MEKINPIVQSCNKYRCQKQKNSGCKSKNDSTQIIQTFYDTHSKPILEQNKNFKNQSSIGPSYLSITCQPSVSERIKPFSKCKSVASNSKYHHKPLLSEIQPEYINVTNTHESKSLQQMKDLKKKFNVIIGETFKPTIRSKREQFSPLKLCDESKFTKKLVQKIRQPRDIQFLMSAKENKNLMRSKRPTSCNCSVDHIICNNQENMVQNKHLHDENLSRNIPFSKDFNKKFEDSKYYNQDYYSSLNNPSKNIFLNDNNQFSDNNYNSFSSHTNNTSKQRNEKYCENCPLHNVVKYRLENFSETHATPTKQKQQSTHQTFILDDRLFPVFLQNKKEDSEPRIPYSRLNTNSFVTLKPTPTPSNFETSGYYQNSSRILPGSLQKDSNILFERNTQRIPAPTNSLALKHQKGIR